MKPVKIPVEGRFSGIDCAKNVISGKIFRVGMPENVWPEPTRRNFSAQASGWESVGDPC